MSCSRTEIAASDSSGDRRFQRIGPPLAHQPILAPRTTNGSAALENSRPTKDVEAAPFLAAKPHEVTIDKSLLSANDAVPSGDV